ncbi:MAG TPA: sigma 54-interacting transcriptional regulator [Clostridium sp.]|uniref:sigma 54-interacting transcriptional regulator n=1 Tax=Clostridium sp. TaxID=1506 RepID=UPI002F94763E
MKEIVFIAPFKNLACLAEEVIEKRKYSNIEVLVGNLSYGVNAAKKVVEQGADIIISRGGTYTMIKEAVDIPVVELTMSSFDILRGFKELINYKGKIGVAGYKNIINGCETIADFLNLNIDRIEIKNEEKAEELLNKHLNEGVQVFVGDVIGSSMAKKLNCKSYIIESGIESVISSMQEARRILKGLKFEKEKAERFKTIINFIHDGIIAIDQEGRITIFNSIAEKIFQISGEEAVGKKVEWVVKGTKLIEVLELGQMKLGAIQEVNGSKIVTNRVPIIVDNKITGVVATFQDITKIQELEHQIRVKLQKKGFVAKYNFDDIKYKSKYMKNCIDRAKTYSRYDSPILILGGSGVGKELFAQSIHNNSKRKNAPFVAINCAAITPNLIESELFGYVEGAFTSAVKGGKTGVFELAHGGTIFLDEIGEMPFELQSKLLRVIQEKEVMRIGDDKVIPIDVRVISTTNKNITQMINQGSFREDLYYRINILTLLVPSLNDRSEDIVELSNFFIKKYCRKYNKDICCMSKSAEDYLNRYNYRGNVRELQGMIERSVILCTGASINIKDIRLEAIEHHNIQNEKNNEIKSKDFKSLTQVENEYINEVLGYCNGNLSEASKILKINRTTLWRKRNNDA